jgi:hypothetical protein
MKILLISTMTDTMTDVWGITMLILAVLLVFKWILNISVVIKLIQKQNEYSLIQVRLLKKMLLNQGTPIEEINDIIEKGNAKGINSK